MTDMAIENGPFISLIYLLKMVIFHGYVGLPEGKSTRNVGSNGKHLEMVYFPACHRLIFHTARFAWAAVGWRRFPFWRGAPFCDSDSGFLDGLMMG